jgi:hypothetical protein
MTVNLTLQQIGAWVARLGSVALIILAAIPADSVPANVRPYLAIAGAVIVAVDRYVTDPSTGTPTPTPPAPTKSVQPVVAAPPQPPAA